MDTNSSRKSAHTIIETLASWPRERLAFSQADVETRLRVARLMEGAGLGVTLDDAFNVIGRLEGSPGCPPLVVGSHTDTVPDPGRFDGALGVVAGIACARHLHESGARLRHPLVIADWSDEEGTLTWGCWGARAVRGRLTVEERAQLDDESSTLSRGLLAGAAHLEAAGRAIDPLRAGACEVLEPAGYLELHVEQGPVLERAEVPVAAVTSIVGIDRYELAFEGVSGHAGTVPMADRNDAVARAADVISRFWSRVLDLGDQAVANVGRITVQPGSFNVIPGRVEVWVEARSYDASIMEGMGGHLRQLVDARGATTTLIGHEEPLALSPTVRRAILDSARAEGLACLELPSWAGHDAGVFALEVPAGMIFVPSIGGASHSPRERTGEADIADALRLLSATLHTLDDRLD